MENFYSLINKKKEDCRKNNLILDDVFDDYFIYGILCNIIEKYLKEVNLNNYEKYNNLDEVNVKEEFIVNSRDIANFMLVYYNTEAKKVDINYIYSKINEFLSINDIGECKEQVEDRKSYEIKTSLSRLTELCNFEVNKFNKKLNDNPDYSLTFKNTIDNLDSIYSEEIISSLYIEKFLNGVIVTLIKHNINEINVLNYKEEIQSTNNKFYIKCKNNNGRKSTGLDIIVPDDFYNKFVSLIQNFINDYHVGQIAYDSDANGLSVFINCSLDELINAYYMEVQRLEYLTEGEKQKILTKK